MNTIKYDITHTEYVIPTIRKVTDSAWAKQMISEGIIYLTNLEVFIKDENQERGDKNERKGTFIYNDIKCYSENDNSTFVWCGSLENEKDVLLDIWKDRNTVVHISNTIEFGERIRKSFNSIYVYEGWFYYSGIVSYDKDFGTKQDYYWGECIFQKNLKYKRQREYRLAMVTDPQLKVEDNICLTLGDCSDLISII